MFFLPLFSLGAHSWHGFSLYGTISSGVVKTKAISLITLHKNDEILSKQPH